MKRKWKNRFIKRGLAWMLCVLLVLQLVGADSLTAMADKAREILTAEAQESTGEGNTAEKAAEEANTEKTKAAEETTTEKATIEETATEKESAEDTTTEKEAASEKITTEKVSATEDTAQPEKEITTEKENAAENNSSTEANSSEDKNASGEGIPAEENDTATTENASTETTSEAVSAEENAGAAGTETNPDSPIGFDGIGSKIKAGIALIAAGESAEYYDPTSGETKMAADAIEVSENETEWTEEWYVVKGSPQLGQITVNGDVNLILSDGAVLYATRGITVSGDNSLTIWGQRDGSGGLEADGAQYQAGIGGQRGQSSGSITIYGGNITANGGNNAAGIGGGLQGNGENIAIHGGTVQAASAGQGAGIGGGNGGAGNNITITGGVVTAQGGVSAAGIGGGAFSGSNGITITGGTVSATAGAGEGPANGIGGGSNYDSSGVMSSGTTMISGGIVTAKASDASRSAIANATIDDNYLHMTYGNGSGLDETETPVEWTGGGSLYEMRQMGWVKIQPMVPKELSIEEENVEAELTGNQDGVQIQLNMKATAEVGGKEISASPIWSDDSNDSWAEGDTIYIYDSESNPKITFTATWGDKTDSVTVTVIQPKVTVYFDTLGNELVESQTISRFEKVEKPEVPKRDGYYVEGWYGYYYKDDEGKEYWDSYSLWDFEQPVTSDNGAVFQDGILSLTLYAKWVEKAEQQLPSGLTGGIRTITGTMTSMEYAKSPNANDWTPCNDGETKVDPGTWYVRYAETDTLNASESVPVKVQDLTKGEGTVTVANIVYGEELKLDIQSETNDPDKVSIEYKKQGADDSTYTETEPTMPGDYTVRVTFLETETSTAAAATADFTIEKAEQELPVGLTGGIRTITGTMTSMEYAESPNANDWTPCSDGETKVEPGTWYVRYAETDTSNASESVSVIVTDKLVGKGTVTVADIVYGEKPNPVIESETNETANATIKYKKQGADDNTYTETVPTMPGNYTVKVTFPETETSTEAVATADFTIRKAEQESPSGLTGGVKTITGTTSAMEYAASENADKWTPCSEGETKLDPGTWYVRYAETDTLNASKSVSVIVTDKLVGKGTVTVADIVYGETPNPVIESETNGTGQAVLEYKKQDAKDKDYSKTVPKNAGKYRVRVTFPETETYMETVATADFTIKKAAGSGTVTANDYYYGGSMTPRLESETNGIKEAVVEYKKAAEPDAKYSKEIPDKPGSYAVRATFPANDNYTKAEATDEFTISYLPTPEKPYSVKGTKGENNYYISDVTITAAKGYLVCANPEGSYAESVTITESKEAGKLYFMKEKTGEKTDGVDFGAVLIDKEAPVIDAEEGKTYYGEKAAVTVRDANLQSVLVNGKKEESDGESITLSLSAEAGATEYELLARDVAGNESRIKITVAAEWTRSGVVPAGTAVKLLRQNPYTLSGGSWQTDGDSTTYAGGRTFYVKEE